MTCTYTLYALYSFLGAPGERKRDRKFRWSERDIGYTEMFLYFTIENIFRSNKITPKVSMYILIHGMEIKHKWNFWEVIFPKHFYTWVTKLPKTTSLTCFIWRLPLKWSILTTLWWSLTHNISVFQCPNWLKIKCKEFNELRLYNHMIIFFFFDNISALRFDSAIGIIFKKYLEKKKASL